MSSGREPLPSWQDVIVSFLPAARRTTWTKERLRAFRLPLILVLQAALTLRLNDIVSNDEALYIQGGQAVIANFLHGGAANASLLRFDGSFFSGAPNVYPVAAAALNAAGGLLLARIFSLLLMLIATLCVYRTGLHLSGERVGLLASLVFALTGSVQYIGKYATFDAPCLALVAVAAAAGITRRSMLSAPLVGALLALAVVTKYAGLALVPFVLLLTFVAHLEGGRLKRRGNLAPAALRATIAAFSFAGLLAAGYYQWGSGIAAGVKFTTTSRHALHPGPTWYLIESLMFDIGIACLLAIGAIVLVLRRRAWGQAATMLIMLAGGLVIQASSVRIHEFTSLDKHTAFSGLFLAVPAAIALDWLLSKRGRTIVLALAIMWILLIDGMWRSNYQYSWPDSVMSPVSEIESLNIPGQYFSFESETGAYYTQRDPAIVWHPSADSYSIFVQGISKVTEAEKSHQFVGFLFDPADLSAQDQGELGVLERLLASDHYYFETGKFPVSPYSKAEWELWLHYPPGYHGPSLRGAPGSAP
jgi:4-amino-4-deoxy-L-arabinose transferase-like glycosyltransferase